MARVVSVIGVTHNPFHYRLTTQPREQWNPDTENMVKRSELMQEKLNKADPQSLIVVGNDHFHQFFMDNMPAFLVGKMELFDGTYYNETREFHLPRFKIPGDIELAQQILEGALKRGVDFAFSNELKVDHSVIVPLILVRPKMDLPIVPIMTNCVAPPLPPADRFYQVGKILRAVIEAIPGDKRIGVILSGNLSLEVGGPLQFDPKPMDEEFDDRAVEWISRGDIDTALRECTFDRMTNAGNVTHAFVNFLLGMAIAQGMRCTHAEGLKRKGSTQPFFVWET